METHPPAAAGCVDSAPCFQFVKRMNGNSSKGEFYQHPVTCFQFVKRMNGNPSVLTVMAAFSCLLPIREAYEWKLIQPIG